MIDKKYTVLCVDDEENVLKSLKRVLRKEPYRFLTSSSGKEGFEILEKEKVQIVLSDQRMPGMSGTEFLARVKELYPDIIRIVLTGYTDVDSITDSINRGNIFKFFLKPWNDENLKQEIRQALKHYDLIKANRELSKKVLDKNKILKKVNANLESMVRERTSHLEIQNRALELSRVMLEEIPYPIIGVSEEMTIVYKNKKACILSGPENLCVGSSLSGSSYEDLEKNIRTALEINDSVSVCNKKFYGGKYNYRVCPLSEDFKGRGVVITFDECV